MAGETRKSKGKGGQKGGQKASREKGAKKQARAAAAPEEVAAEVAGEPIEEERTEFELSNEAVEIALQTGEHAGLLEDYFGPEEYRELRQLSREAASRRVRGGPKVLILPGIMGSKIGKRRKLLFDDVYWFDPADVFLGRLDRLALADDGSSRFEALGAILLAYLKLKLRLVLAGYDADFHAFDWRKSLTDLGKELADRLKEENRGLKEDEESRVNLVAHSMGGLVARAALGQGGRCRRLVMLGTPNFGSFAPVLALRATYPVVRKLGSLDQKHSPEELAEKIFSTFPGLLQMLPHPDSFKEVDLYDLAAWPPPGEHDLRPREAILAGVKGAQKRLAPGDDRMFLVAGVNQETVTGLERKVEDGEVQFVYLTSQAGDGTVPLTFCELPGIAATYYVEESHGSLPNNKQVARAVADLLDRGKTEVLASQRPAVRREVRRIGEETLRVDPYEGRRGGRLSQRELRSMLEEVVSPEARDTALAPPVTAPAVAGAPLAQVGFQHPFEDVTVGRRRQHRIDLTFARGSITEVDARAIALGIFRDVAPSGAASALDRRLEGAITDISRRRMFGGEVGEIFMLPTGRHDLRADLIAFVGLGPFDRFNSEVLQTAAENIIRTFVNTRVEEFATVLFGGGSGGDVADALRNLLSGFVRGLLDADRQHRFRRIVLCEYDSGRYTRMKEELFRLSSTSLCRDVEMTFNELELPAAPSVRALPRRLAPAAGEDPAYLIVRRECLNPDKSFDVRSSVLTAGSKATVVTGVQTVAQADFDDLRREVERVRSDDFSQVGQTLSQLFLAEEVRAVLEAQAELPREQQRHLVVVHDAPLSQVPWETLALPAGGEQVWYPAAVKGLSHRYAADNLSVAKWLEERIEDEELRVLLVVDPTLDLPGAEEEGNAVKQIFADLPGCRLDVLWQGEATRPALLSAFSSGQYDVIHYAGHAFFDEANPERSGVFCHPSPGVPLTGADLAGLGNLPTLVFFNACEAGRVRGRRPERLAAGALAKRVSQAVGLAEAFMRGGVANFIGTYWPVGDAEALAFSETFYKKVLLGVAEDGAEGTAGSRRPATLGEAFQAARNEVRERKSKDWANYILYGNPDFVLKAGGR